MDRIALAQTPLRDHRLETVFSPASALFWRIPFAVGVIGTERAGADQWCPHSDINAERPHGRLAGNAGYVRSVRIPAECSSSDLI